VNNETYVAAEHTEWVYEKPKRGGKTLLLTIGGICLTGNWTGELGQYFMAWAPMLKRNKVLEAEILKARKA